MPPAKKRTTKGRTKKILSQSSVSISDNDTNRPKQNIILHLKCNKKDVEKVTFLGDHVYKSTISNVCSFENDNLDFSVLNSTGDKASIRQEVYGTLDTQLNHNNHCQQQHQQTDNDNCVMTSYTRSQLIENKLKKLNDSFQDNTYTHKKSKCFFCTESFYGAPVRIPKCRRGERYDVYGCFCSPECSVGYLFNDNLDDSEKWERYTLINKIYSPIFNYTKPIKPSPSPFYTLDTYFGNLSIDEYRHLHTSHNKLKVINKPLIHILPVIQNIPVLENIISDGNVNVTSSPSAQSKTTYSLQRKKKKASKKEIHGNLWTNDN